jgi:hypothetical protein
LTADQIGRHHPADAPLYRRSLQRPAVAFPLGIAFVGFGNSAQPVNDGRCRDRCYSETVVPKRVRRVLERAERRRDDWH